MSDAAASPADWFVLDRDYRITAANTSSGIPEQHIGAILWDAFPEAESIYADLYATAWRTGHAATHAFHRGTLLHVAADRVSVGLLVAYRVLAVLDTLTLTGLSRSLDLLADLLARAEQGSDRPSRTALQIVPLTPDH